MKTIVVNLAQIHQDQNRFLEDNSKVRGNPAVHEDTGEKNPTAIQDEGAQGETASPLQNQLDGMLQAQQRSVAREERETRATFQPVRERKRNNVAAVDSSDSDIDLTGVPRDEDSDDDEIGKIPFFSP